MSRLIWHGVKIQQQLEWKVPGILRRIKEVIADRARQLVSVKTGKLKASISVTEDGVVVEEDYAAEVELGTDKKAAQPFLRPAVEQFNQNDLKQCVK